MEYYKLPLPNKMTIPQILLSLSIFSFSSFFLYSHHEKISFLYANLFHLLNQGLNKNCIFLICNGLLLFLAKTSGFVPSPSASDLNEMSQKRIGDGLNPVVEFKEPFTQKIETVEETVVKGYYDQPKEDEKYQKEEEDDEEEKRVVMGEEDECMKNEVCIFIGDSDLEDDGEENDGKKTCWMFDDDEEDEVMAAVRAEAETLSTEELNRKFEEFIRRMKEEMWIDEAHRRQQLVLVK